MYIFFGHRPNADMNYIRVWFSCNNLPCMRFLCYIMACMDLLLITCLLPLPTFPTNSLPVSFINTAMHNRRMQSPIKELFILCDKNNRCSFCARTTMQCIDMPYGYNDIYTLTYRKVNITI